jgi:phospholipid/cholesterol/gamma-HCH transport system permease protein
MTEALGEIRDEIGRAVLFLCHLLKTSFRHPTRFTLIAEQIWKVTLQSLPTTALAGFFVGAVMCVQFALQVAQFDAMVYLGGLATSGTVREVGPLLIAFMLSGKVGAFTSAELGTMKVTEQMDAIRCLGANPFQEIIFPRFIAIIISSFFLLAAGLVMSVSGGILLGILFAGLTADEYVRYIPTFLAPISIMSGLFKCLVFSIVLGVICTYVGYNADGGARGVGRAVVKCAVATMIGLVIADWLTTVIVEAVTRAFVG